MRPRSMIAGEYVVRRELTPVFLILDTVFVLFQIAGQYLAASAEAADLTDAEPMFSVGVRPSPRIADGRPRR